MHETLRAAEDYECAYRTLRRFGSDAVGFLFDCDGVSHRLRSWRSEDEAVETDTYLILWKIDLPRWSADDIKRTR